MTTGMNGRDRFLNQYLRLTLLGEGGMGEVWAARDTSALGVRIVALKTTKQQGTEAAKVLFDEARIASQIDHPNVCRVHEFGRVGDTQYLVLDWCDGANLHELLQSMTEQVLPLGLSAWLTGPRRRRPQSGRRERAGAAGNPAANGAARPAIRRRSIPWP